MAQSFRKRLEQNGGVPKFVEFVERHGVWSALDKYQIGYLPARKLLNEESKDENFGLHTGCSIYGQKSFEELCRCFVSSFADYVVRTDKEIEFLKVRLEHYESDARPTMEIQPCNTDIFGT